MAQRYRPVPADSYVTSGFGPRWGTVHRGTDFGKTGGSANMPVYAAQGGTVVHAGAASGFGGPDPAGWLVIDHPAADGAGTTVYGHIIRDPHITVGTRVEAGQRIGRVNPSQATNGNVAPHLHFEVHKYTWLPGSQIDPIPWLGDAPSPGEGKKADVKPTIYGIDISNHQNGFSITRAREEGFKFVLIKATEGTWKDPIFRSHLNEAKGLDIHYGAYVYVREETSAEAHARALHEVVDDPSIPIALDIEHGAGSNPAHWRAIRDAIEARGYRVILTYLPNWYWNQVGSPDLSGLPPLWTSNYPSTRRDYASVLYSTAGRAGWTGYGGLDVKVWQFTDRASVAGWHVDANAFEGTQADLDALFLGTPTETTTLTPDSEELELSDIDRRRIELTMDQLAGPGKTDTGEPNFHGWDYESVLEAAKHNLANGLGLTLVQQIALVMDKQDKQEQALGSITEAISQLINAVTAINKHMEDK